MQRKYQAPLCAVMVTVALLLASSDASSAVYTVTNTNDAFAGSLRQAITDANNSAGKDSIQFNIPGAGPHVISPASQLPSFGDSVIVDGYSQPGSSENTLAVGNDAVLKIVIDCGSLGAATGAIVLNNNSLCWATIRGLVLNNGQNQSGARYIESRDGGGGCLIEGCFLGTDPTGMSVIGSYPQCIVTEGPDLIGGNTPAARNVIAGGSSGNVYRGTSSSSAQIKGNYIGVNAQGDMSLTLPSATYSVQVGAVGTTIGGATAAERNVIAPASRYAIQVFRTTTIRGNYVGTDATGTFDLGEGSGENYGVHFDGGALASNSVVSENLISGFVLGVFVLNASHVTIQGNFIGTDALGNPTLGNATGILLDGTAGACDSAVIGGILPGEGNVVAGNNHGVVITQQRFIAVRGNSMFSNHPGIGIELYVGGNGVTPNDLGDADLGPNNLQNFPVLTEALSQPTQTKITGTLNSTPNTQFRVDYYYNVECDSTGYGEGEQYLGGANVTTDGSGDVSFLFTPIQVPDSGYITATATDPDGNTSEFCACMLVLLDSDGDNLADINDNCPFVVNPGQEDADGDSIGNDCDTLEVKVLSPVDIFVISPSGLDTIGPGINTFGSRASYDSTQDIGLGANGIPGELDDRVTISPVEPGQYKLRIIPEQQLGPQDTAYFLGIRDPGGNIAGDGWVAMTGANAPSISPIPVANPVPQPNEEHVIYVGGLCDQRRGDLTGEGVYNVQDVVQVINIAFRGQTVPDPAFIADVNSDGVASNVQDVVRIVGHVFRGAPEPGP